MIAIDAPRPADGTTPAGLDSPTGTRSKLRRRIQVLATQLLVIIFAITIWHLGTKGFSSNNAILSRLGPTEAFSALAEQLRDGTAITHTIASLRRLLLGLLFAVVIGIPLGLVIGLKSGISEATAPLVQFLRMLSPLAWAPAAVAIFGIGDAPVTFLVATATVWPLLLGTAAGVRAVDQGWLLVARSLGATPLERLRTVLLPAVKAPVLTSLRLALGVGWVVLVPAEMLGVDSGLGYAVLNARDQLAYDHLAATMLLIGLVGFIIDAVFQRVLQPKTH